MEQTGTDKNKIILGYPIDTGKPNRYQRVKNLAVMAAT
jgi:hypothetical protein